MKTSEKLQNFENESKNNDSYWVEKLKIDFALQLEKRRKSENLSYSDMAKKIKSSAAYITKVFRGDSNFTIESMVKLAKATGGKIEIFVIDERPRTEVWAGAGHLPVFRTNQINQSGDVRYQSLTLVKNNLKEQQQIAA
jgi:transcriptional regulator with XRE-family HTH domain